MFEVEGASHTNQPNTLTEVRVRIRWTADLWLRERSGMEDSGFLEVVPRVLLR